MTHALDISLSGVELNIEDFEDFFRAVHPQVVRYVARRAADDIADDVASLTFRTLWCKDLSAPADPDEQRALRSLAFRVADGHLRNMRRSMRNADRLIVTLVAALSHEAAPTAMEIAQESSLSSSVLPWTNALSTAELTVSLLLADGYHVAEIAAELGCSPAAVSMRLFRARSKARAALKDVATIEQLGNM